MKILRPLTKRETETAYWLSIGLSQKTIADRMGVSPKTTQVYLRVIREKIGAETTLQAGIFFSHHLGTLADLHKAVPVRK